MALTVGFLIAFAVGVLGTGSGLDRDRAYYPVVTIVVAHYYALFAALGASTQTLVVESLSGAVFVAAAVWGFKSSLWLVAVALDAAPGVRVSATIATSTSGLLAGRWPRGEGRGAGP